MCHQSELSCHQRMVHSGLGLCRFISRQAFMLHGGWLNSHHRLCLTKSLGLPKKGQGPVIVLTLEAGRQEGIAIVCAWLHALLLHAFPQSYGALHLSRLRGSMQADLPHSEQVTAAGLTGILSVLSIQNAASMQSRRTDHDKLLGSAAQDMHAYQSSKVPRPHRRGMSKHSQC